MKWPIEGDNLEWSALTGALSVEESMIVVVKNPPKWKKKHDVPFKWSGCIYVVMGFVR